MERTLEKDKCEMESFWNVRYRYISYIENTNGQASRGAVVSVVSSTSQVTPEGGKIPSFKHNRIPAKIYPVIYLS